MKILIKEGEIEERISNEKLIIQRNNEDKIIKELSMDNFTKIKKIKSE